MGRDRNRELIAEYPWLDIGDKQLTLYCVVMCKYTIYRGVKNEALEPLQYKG